MFNFSNSIVALPLNYCDAPRAWGVYFQDSASPQMEALVELHDNIMFYLVIVLFGVGWILLSVIRNYASSKSPISNKFLNHGKVVPIQKYSNFNIQKRYYRAQGFNTKTPVSNDKTSHLHNNAVSLDASAFLKKNSEPSSVFFFKKKISSVKGNPVNIYEKCSKEEFKLIGNFISARKAGLFLGFSGSTIIKYMHSGEIFKDRYKFSGR